MPSPPDTSFSYFPPNCFDRADGLEGRPGTPDPISGAYLINTSQGGTFFLEEESNSPEIERSEQGTIVHKFRCNPQTANILITTIGRGYLLIDSAGNTSRVVNSRLSYNKGNVVGIQITAESLSFDLPPDEFSLEVVELNPALTKHPRYNLLTYRERQLVTGANLAEVPEFADMYSSILNSIPANVNPLLDHRRQAQELALKYHKGEDSFYLPGFRIQYSTFNAFPVPLNPGGYIEDPIGSGNLPYYFWSTAIPQDHNQSNNIFSQLADINPTIYQTGISWLRLCDTLQYQRTWFRLTTTWQGGPLGAWDAELYTANPLPYQTSENQQMFFRP